MAQTVKTVTLPSRLFADVDQLSASDYEPCSTFAEMQFTIKDFDTPVAATVTLTKDQTTVGGRPRVRFIIAQAAVPPADQ